jgi:hypothetical protein
MGLNFAKTRYLTLFGLPDLEGTNDQTPGVFKSTYSCGRVAPMKILASKSPR